MARYLRRADDDLKTAPVVQVFPDTPRGQAFARGLRETRESIGMSPPTDVVLAVDEALNEKVLKKIAAQNPAVVLALWIDADDLEALAAFEKGPRPVAAFLSAPLLGDSLAGLPEGLRSFTLFTHPTAFPEDKTRTRLAIERWLEIREIPLTNYDIQAKMYFVGWDLAGLVKMMRNEFYRDRFLDIMDMMRDQDYAVGVYERLSFGPGQRYASKGCYLTALTAGPEPSLEKRSGWVVH